MVETFEHSTQRHNQLNLIKVPKVVEPTNKKTLGTIELCPVVIVIGEKCDFQSCY